MPVLRLAPEWLRPPRLAGVAAIALALGAILVENAPAVRYGPWPLPPGALPPIKILPSKGVQTKLDLHTAKLIAHALLRDRPATRTTAPLRIRLIGGAAQAGPGAIVNSRGHLYRLQQDSNGKWIRYVPCCG
jgi:hypothetical protein